jgi:hypothetical protein
LVAPSSWDLLVGAFHAPTAVPQEANWEVSSWQGHDSSVGFYLLV